MASNGLQYFTTYLQSHEDRYAKFRQEAYDELVLQNKMDAEYRKELREREKVLQDALDALRKGKGGPGDLEILKEMRAVNQAKSDSLDKGRKARLDIRQSLQGDLEVPQAAQTKLAESANTLATSGSLIGDAAGVKALIEGQITDISSSVKGGTRNAASTAQQLWKQLKTDKNWSRLSPADRDSLEQTITAQFGLDTVNIGGISGDALLDTPQDVLLQKEEELLLKKEGGAYGVKTYDQLQTELQKLLDSGASEEEIKAKQAELAEAVAPLQTELAGIREKLRAEPEIGFPSEAAVRQRAAEKYGFEAPKFMKEQFARDVLGDDKDKLLHYDAIQAAKTSPIDKESEVYKQALILSQNKQLLGESKSEQRRKIIEKAAEFAGDSTDRRDQLLIAYHQIQMDEQRAKYEPSKLLPEPKPLMDVDMTPTKDTLPEMYGIKTDEEGYRTTKGGERMYVPPAFREREAKQPRPFPPPLPQDDEFKETYTPAQKIQERLQSLSMADLFNLEG